MAAADPRGVLRRWAGSPRASTSSTCCASRARCRCPTSAASISCSTSSPTRRSSRSSRSSRSTRRPSICTSRSAACSAARARSTARSACTRTCSTGPTCRADKRQTAMLRARAGLPPRGAARPRRGAVRQARRHAVRAPVAGASCCRSTRQEKDWPKAIAVTRRMEALAKQPYHKEIAHYHCELAQAALLQVRLRDRAGRPRRGARRVPRRAPRANDARRRHRSCSSGDRRRGASTRGRRIESQNPAFLALVAERLADAYRQDRPRGRGPAGAARLPAAVPVARPPQRRVHADARRGRRRTRPSR